MICPECGTANKDFAKFCKNCGNTLNPKNTIEKIYSSPNGSNSAKNKNNGNLIIICATVIICVAILAFCLASTFSNNGSVSDSSIIFDNDSSSVATVESDSSSSSISQDDNLQDSNIFIKYCDFYTGDSLSDKSYCSANIGAEHYGETYKISVQYSNNGSPLNDGVSATKTVDEEGFLHIYTSNAFEYYPDKAVVDIYDANGNFLTEETYNLEETSGQQSFGH